MSKPAAAATIGLDVQQVGVPLGNQPQARVVGGHGRLRGAEDGADEVVVEVRRTQRELGLLQGEQAVVMPGRLPEDGKRQRMSLNDLGVGRGCLQDVGVQIGGEQARGPAVSA